MDQDLPMDLETDWVPHLQRPQEPVKHNPLVSACIARSIEMDMDNYLTQQLSYASSTTERPQPQSETRKRGRKPLRPNDPIRKKTEEKDKFWLRAFRSYMKTIYHEIEGSICPSERVFWEEFFTLAGKPSKGRR